MCKIHIISVYELEFKLLFFIFYFLLATKKAGTFKLQGFVFVFPKATFKDKVLVKVLDKIKLTIKCVMGCNQSSPQTNRKSKHFLFIFI